MMEKSMDEYNYVSKYSENSYIQNNTRAILQEINILTPSFKSQNFISFAQEVLKNLVDDSGFAETSVVDDSAGTFELPGEIDGFELCYLHNYIIENDMESLKLLFNVITKGMTEKYFVVFSRDNPRISITRGEAIVINCPNCGGNVNFPSRRMMVNCPYCGNVVTFAEYDWRLVSVEHINDDTKICNRAVIKL